MGFVVGLDAPEATDPAVVGGKAAALAVLARGGFEVPATLCLTTAAYQVFVDAAALRPVILQELGRKSFDDMRWEEIWDTALRIRNRFLRAPVPESVASEIEDRVGGLFGSAVLAVRSSAPGEDAEGASFAGLHDSTVGVRGPAEVVGAVRSVWASLWTDRALLYRRELGIDPERSAMAVVIQPLINGRVSGVGFGIHPTDRDLMVVEAVHGLNQGLVDGAVEPDVWQIDRSNGRLTDHRPPSKRQRMVMSEGGSRVEAVPIDTPPLDDAALGRVVSAIRAAGELVKSPQDVEWTFDRDRLVVLQSRPVTTAAGSEGDQRAWYLSLTRSLDSLRKLRTTVETEMLPAMDRQAEELDRVDLEGLDHEALAAEIERRQAAHDRWVETYWRDFIPLAHGIRLFGQFYNEVVRPDDPYEFMDLLTGTPMLGVRRNRALADLVATLRDDPTLRSSLAEGGGSDAGFEAILEGFLAEHGAAVFADRACFADRDRFVRWLLAAADAPTRPRTLRVVDTEGLAESFLEAVAAERRQLAAEILDVGRASYRLRDDDNLHLARLEALVLAAVDEGRDRIQLPAEPKTANIDSERVILALRHPNLIVEPQPAAQPLVTEPGVRAQPRQLVGQPAGPGVATGRARLVESVDDLFELEAGEVLVCDAIDPNMTFVVPLAAAVVERRGGMLVHGAIIAREYGLPCVTGVPDVTAQIANGDRLTVDGYVGIVTISR